MARRRKQSRRRITLERRLHQFYRRWTGTRRGMWLGLVLLIGLVGLLGLASCLVSRPENESLLVASRMEQAPRIRVLLEQGIEAVEVAVEDEFELVDEDGELLSSGDELPPTSLRLDEGELRLGDIVGSGPWTLRPLGNTGVQVGERSYRGGLRIHATKDGLMVVNEVDIESYLLGVLGHEMPLSWPEGALMAQAVAARSYAIFQIERNREAIYHVRSDTGSQVYGGRGRESDVAIGIIRDTAGVVLTWDYHLFCTYFHSTCGGRTVPAHEVFAEADITPLSGVPCTYCAESKFYRWEGTLDRAAVSESLAKAGFGGAPVSGIEIKGRTRAGHATEVMVIRPGVEPLTLAANRFRLVVGPSVLRSTAFDLLATGDELHLRGRGWGHGVGMCQWGARGLALKGHTAEEILQHYYPGSELYRLY